MQRNSIGRPDHQRQHLVEQQVAHGVGRRAGAGVTIYSPLAGLDVEVGDLREAENVTLWIAGEGHPPAAVVVSPAVKPLPPAAPRRAPRRGRQ